MQGYFTAVSLVKRNVSSFFFATLLSKEMRRLWDSQKHVGLFLTFYFEKKHKSSNWKISIWHINFEDNFQYKIARYMWKNIK